MDCGELKQVKDVIADDGLDRSRTQLFDLVRLVGGVILVVQGFFVHSNKVAGRSQLRRPRARESSNDSGPWLILVLLSNSPATRSELVIGGAHLIL